MKICDECKYAVWERTKNGRLHPNKRGACVYPWKMPPLPNAYYFTGGPYVSGGFIERGREYENHCPYGRGRSHDRSREAT